MYTPSEPSLKLRAIEPAASPPTQASEIKTGSFLDALKQGSQFTFSSPTPGTSIIPSAASGGNIGTTGTSTSVVSPPTTVVSSTTGPPPGLFQFGSGAVNSTTSGGGIYCP